MTAKRRDPGLPSSQPLDEWIVSSHNFLDPNTGPIEALYQACSSILNQLWKSKFKWALDEPRKSKSKADVARLRLWEDNFPPGRLDTILERSHYLRQDVIENLHMIGRILVQYCEGTRIYPDDETMKTNPIEGLGALLEKATIMLSEEEGSSSSDSGTESNASLESTSERNRFGRLHCYINCLVELGPSIEKHASNMQSGQGKRALLPGNVFSISQSAQPFAIRIKDRFNDAQIPLVERLAEANWERSVRMRAQAEQEDSEEEDSPGPRAADAMTMFFSAFQDSGLGTSIPTQSQYAASHTSFLSVAGEGEGRPRVPPMPPAVKGALPFKCPYCKKYTSCKNRIQWKMHVFADLQAYICTHNDCQNAFQTFPSRRLWADHEFNAHFFQTYWRCFICSITESSPEKLVNHLQAKHRNDSSGPGLEAQISHSQESTLRPEFKSYPCPLCLKTDWQTKKTYTTHVGQHLEEISLASLPQTGNDDSDSNHGGQSQSISSNQGDQNKVLTDRSHSHDCGSTASSLAKARRFSPSLDLDKKPHYLNPDPIEEPPSSQYSGPNFQGHRRDTPEPEAPGVGTSSSIAPGPIPATTPLVVRKDNNGVSWITFKYSRDRVKMEYTIRADVETVNVDDLSQEFRGENCVYPRAFQVNKDQYKGNRLVYETECNAVGWALAHLNPILRGKRGLIQRAVDSWRNSNQDPRLRSRRVRRVAKWNRRKPSTELPTHAGTNDSEINHAPDVKETEPLTITHRSAIDGSIISRETTDGPKYDDAQKGVSLPI